MGFTKFQDIIAWQKSKVLVSRIYAILNKCKDYSYRDQVQRAAISIMSNIAEGYGRNSMGEFSRYLEIAKGSSYEVESLLEVGFLLKYITKIEYDECVAITNEISKMLRSLINTLKIAKRQPHH